MPDWLNMSGSGRVSALGEAFNIANGGGVSFTCGAANTKGSWAVVSAATPYEAHGVCVVLAVKSAGVDLLVDIGMGTAGNECVIIPNLLWTGGSSSSYNKCFFVPLNIPAGVRLVVRAQSIAGSHTGRCSVTLFEAGMLGMPSIGRVVAFGADTAATGGLALGNPAGANTWGAWTELASSAGQNLKWVMPVPGDGGITTRTSGSRHFLQMGTGAAAAEIGLGPEYPFSSSSTSFSTNMFHGFWADIPSSERLAMRYGISATTTVGCDGMIYGGW
jgi:hypothetical protein